jgi:hypothetical protein
LKEVLEDTIPEYSNEIFALAAFLVTNDELFTNCQKWLENSEISKCVNCRLSSEDIERILFGLSSDDVDRFYEAWSEKHLDSLYYAIDATSESSYSKLVDDGGSRESLPQVNICMLMGKTSKLPICVTTYPYSLKDKKDLEATLSQLDKIADRSAICAVMDTNFCDSNNINALLSEHKKFVIALPAYTPFAKDRIAELKRVGEDTLIELVIGSDSLRYAKKKTTYGSVGRKLVNAGIFYNPVKAALVKSLPDKSSLAKLPPLKILENEYAGWLVAISGHIESTREMISLYRRKDIFAKAFRELEKHPELEHNRIGNSSVKMTPDEIEKTIFKMPTGKKKSVAFRTKKLINKGAFLSNELLTALEKSLNVELISR